MAHNSGKPMAKDPINQRIEQLKRVKPLVVNIDLPKTIDVSELSEDSQEVLQYFGLEAPSLLNEYAMAIEDVFLDLIKKYKVLQIENTELIKKLK